MRGTATAVTAIFILGKCTAETMKLAMHRMGEFHTRPATPDIFTF